MHLAGERHHRVALAGPLGVPENAQLALPRLAVSHRIDGPVDTQELVIAGDDFLRLARRLVEKNEVLHKVHEVTFVTDSLEQRLHVHDTRLFFGEPLPFMEMLPLAGNASDLRLLTVAEHHHRVVVEDVGNGIAVVRVVLLKGSPEVPVDVLALDEK